MSKDHDIDILTNTKLRSFMIIFNIIILYTHHYLYHYSLTIWFVCIIDNLLVENKLCRADAQGDGCLIRRRKPFQRDLFAHSLDLFTHSCTSRFTHICTVRQTFSDGYICFSYSLQLVHLQTSKWSLCISFPFQIPDQ